MKVEKWKNPDERRLEDIKRSESMWKRNQILLLSFLCRIILVYYGHIHDYLFEVRFYILVQIEIINLRVL